MQRRRARPGVSGHAERRARRAGLDQQRVDVAVVAARELDDDVAAGERRGRGGCALIVASVPDDTRRTISIDGTRSQMQLGQLDLGSVRRAEAGAACAAAASTASTHARVGVAEDQRPPRADVVEVAVAVDVVEVGALAPLKKSGVPPTPPKARTGRVHPAGDDPPRAVEEALAAGSLDAHESSRVSRSCSGWYRPSRPLAFSAAANCAGVPVRTGKVA